jgi:hypothetical protein
VRRRDQRYHNRNRYDYDDYDDENGYEERDDYEVEIWPSGAFHCSQNSNDFFRFILLRQTGSNMNGSHTLDMENIEFFGRIKE